MEGICESRDCLVVHNVGKVDIVQPVGTRQPPESSENQPEVGMRPAAECCLHYLFFKRALLRHVPQRRLQHVDGLYAVRRSQSARGLHVSQIVVRPLSVIVARDSVLINQ